MGSVFWQLIWRILFKVKLLLCFGDSVWVLIKPYTNRYHLNLQVMPAYTHHSRWSQNQSASVVCLDQTASVCGFDLENWNLIYSGNSWFVVLTWKDFWLILFTHFYIFFLLGASKGRKAWQLLLMITLKLNFRCREKRRSPEICHSSMSSFVRGLLTSFCILFCKHSYYHYYNFE